MPNRIDTTDAPAVGLDLHRFDAPEATPALSVRAVPPSAAAHARPRGWEGPTLAELAERVEHQFGDTPGLAGIFTLGFGRDEPLTPGDIHEVCEHLGLPAEDFGVGN